MTDKHLLKILNLSLLTLVLLTGCLSDELPEPNVELCETEEFNALTYDDDLVQIVSANCAFSGCHGSGAPIGDFTTYESMLPSLNNDRIFEEVIIDMTMPLGGVLTETERDIFNCWIANGFPKN